MDSGVSTTRVFASSRPSAARGVIGGHRARLAYGAGRLLRALGAVAKRKCPCADVCEFPCCSLAALRVWRR